MSPLPARRRGFTLIEMVVTLTIFILLTGSVFGIMTAVFQSSNDLQANQNRRDEITALREFLQTSFTRLGSSDHFIPYTRRQNDGMIIDGLLFGAPGKLLALDATPQANGFYLLRLGQPADDISVASFRQQLERNQSAVDWKPLIRDVRVLAWKFQDRSSPDWLDGWTRDLAKPALVECSIQLAGDDAPATIDFQIPRLGIPPVNAHLQGKD